MSEAPASPHRLLASGLVLLVACSGSPSTDPTDSDVARTPRCPAVVPASDPRLDVVLAEVRNQLGRSTADAGPSGAGVAVVVDGVLHAAAGVGDQAKDGQPRSEIPVEASTMFWIGSTSKWVTAVAVMSAVQDGTLDLDRSVTAYLPAYTETNGQQDAITLHHLLSMSSGLANDGGCWAYSVSASHTPDGCARFVNGPGTVLAEAFRPEVLAASPYDGSLGVYNITSRGRPGEAPWFYSNWGYMLAGRVLEAADGGAFPDIARRRVFEPADMCTAGYTADDMTAEDDYAIGGGPASVDGHCPEPEVGHDSVQPFFPDELACPLRDPNGGVRASALDVGRFAEALLADLGGEGRVLDQGHAAALLCPGGTVDGACLGRISTGGSPYGATYGYANFGSTEEGFAVFNHGGARAGYGSLLWIVPERGFAIAIVGNDDGIASQMVPAARLALRCFLEGQC